MMATNKLQWHQPVSIAPLVTFRIGFGLLMFFSLIRFWWRGWIATAYLNPSFHFTYQGFEWVQPYSEGFMHLLFLCIIIAALFIAIGFLYRVSTIVFFLGFTYVELIDITTYLNHYYFISLVAFILIWLPANRAYALDVVLSLLKKRMYVPKWNIGILRFQIAIVYIFAGIAKLNSDWLLDAEPMKTWLPAKSHLPIIGSLLYEDWVAYLFSWFGAIYDLFIVFFLLNATTRKWAYVFVLIFHLSTALFFPTIGMFPYVMIVSSLVFFSGNFHQRLLSFLPGQQRSNPLQEPSLCYAYKQPRIITGLIVLYAVIQLALPLRSFFYPGHLFWHEQGYRFSWRVMLMEKAGVAYFTVKDKSGKASYVVDNKTYLTPLQEKMMSTQPDMILKYAQHLAKKYKEKGVEEPMVFAEVYVTLNGERSALFIDSSINLAAQKISWQPYQWIQPYVKTKKN